MMENSWPLSNLRRYSTYSLERGLARNLLFFVRIKTRTSCHKIKREKVAKTTVAREPVDTTSKHCGKSPSKTTTLPPKGDSGCYMMSHKVRFITPAQCRCYAEASSQTISFASHSSSAESLCTIIEHIESLLMAIGILKIECEVYPPSNRKIVMSKKATPMATCLSCRTNANNMLYTKVLPDPPGLSRKTIVLSP
jgi:hypothetical protein